MTKAKKKNRKGELKKVYRDLSKLNLFPSKVFQGEKIINLIQRDDIYNVELNRPFVVVEAIDKTKNKEEVKTVIYKRQLEDTSFFESIKKEAIMHRFILPEIYKNLPKKIKEKVYFPKFIKEIKENGRIRAFIRENANGIICGSRYANKKNIWSIDDIKAIAYVIKEFQKIDPKKVKKAGFNQLPEMNFLKLQRELFDKHIEPIKKTLGKEYVEKTEEVFQEYKRIIPKQQSILLSEEIFCYNIVKMPDGKLGFIDWERPYTGKDESSDYGKFISRLWVNPKLQKEAVKFVLEINKDNPYFKDLLKATLIGHLFHYYYKRQKSKNFKEKKEAERAVGVFKKLFKDILDNKGIWQEEIQ